jgi:beta-galactosidase/beta-glucuronidase
MSNHRIHLKGPWQCEWLSPTDVPAASIQRVKMPIDWRSVFGEQAGRVVLRRKFHKPTNLDADETVFVVFDGISGRGDVRLDDQILGPVEETVTTLSFEITALLQPTNELLVELDFDPHRNPDTDGGLWGPVAIEIRSTEESQPDT